MIMMMNNQQSGGQYRSLLIMTVLSFASMYILMYSMVDTFVNVYSNLNEFYMAGLMTAPMVLIELVLMRKMYPIKRLNVLVMMTSLIGLLVCFVLLRQQAGISDRQFLKSMIPHHAGAILMCNEASISDPEILELCKNIKSSQQTEINQMKAILARLNK